MDRFVHVVQWGAPAHDFSRWRIFDKAEDANEVREHVCLTIAFEEQAINSWHACTGDTPCTRDYRGRDERQEGKKEQEKEVWPLLILLQNFSFSPRFPLSVCVAVRTNDSEQSLIPRVTALVA